MRNLEVGSTGIQLQHFYSNYINILNLMRSMEKIVDTRTISRHKQKFIDGIELTIRLLNKGELSETEGVGEAQLNEILEIAKTYDWEQESTLDTLRETYQRILGE